MDRCRDAVREASPNDGAAQGVHLETTALFEVSRHRGSPLRWQRRRLLDDGIHGVFPKGSPGRLGDGNDLRAGGMVSFTVAGGDERALRVMRRLQVACEATSLGGVETLVSTPFNSSHFSLTPDERRAARIDDGMIRVSCGVEPADVLIADFLRALDETR